MAVSEGETDRDMGADKTMSRDDERRLIGHSGYY